VRDANTFAGRNVSCQVICGPEVFSAVSSGSRVRTRSADGVSASTIEAGITTLLVRRVAEQRPPVGAVLDEIDVLIDGPFVAGLAEHGGP
jgi:hypothetical protein